MNGETVPLDLQFYLVIGKRKNFKRDFNRLVTEIEVPCYSLMYVYFRRNFPTQKSLLQLATERCNVLKI